MAATKLKASYESGRVEHFIVPDEMKVTHLAHELIIDGEVLKRVEVVNERGLVQNHARG